MTKEQAIIFFPFTPEDDLEELWETRFFELKQYFLTHTPVRKVWKSKLQRLQKAYQAYLVLTNQTSQEKDFDFSKKVKNEPFSDEIIASFHEFYQLKNRHKTIVFQAQTLGELLVSVENWLEVEDCFSKHWAFSGALHNAVSAIRIQTPDPMELLTQLKYITSELGFQTVQEMHENYDILPEMVKKEVKRLTLLAND